MKARKKSRKPKTTRQTKKVMAPKPPSTYTGHAIPATKVYFRKMREFKKCDAAAWILVNELNDTTCFANTYNGALKASFNPRHYTWPTNPKKLAAKIEKMEEVEVVADWPAWIVMATSKSTSKAK